MVILEVVIEISPEIITVLYFAIPISEKHLHFKAGKTIVFIMSKNWLPFFEPKIWALVPFEISSNSLTEFKRKINF